ncbi:hypothetical protein DVH24_040818 [Malus domestica]|uniref:EamA domain-containing protein n=2 Tax=Malus TaxID=3749 RepID=A0A498IDN9_MALDO|nr:hypothetical protein DVH24_040818 [Malus domestica]
MNMSMTILLPYIGMVMAIMAQTGSVVVNKAAMSTGTNAYIIVVYANAVAALILLPSGLIFHRSERPPLTFSILCRIFLLGLMETVNWRSSSSQAKVFGTVMSIGGAFVVTFYKGLPIIRLSASLPNSLYQIFSSSRSNWILGGLFLAVHAFSISLWYILQATVVKKYPAILLSVFFQCLFATIQSAIFALIAVRDASAWEIRLDVGLIAVLYTGIVATVLYFSVIVWCVEKVGAFYCSMFKPLGIIFGVIMGAIFLGDSVYLGSLVGAAIIVTGFYAMMWGKATEEKLIEIESLHQNKLPLLQNGIQDKRSRSIGAQLSYVNTHLNSWFTGVMGRIAALPIVGMVLAECAQAGLIIISKIAMSNGMSNLIFLCYSNALAALILLPISLVFHRSERPPLTISIIGWFFLLGLIGFMAQFLGYAGINFSSPTLSTAMLNLIPAFTFVLAVIFRMERIDMRSFSSLAKTVGTIVSISGAFIVTLYKGPPILKTSSSVMTDVLSHKQLISERSNWVLGGVCVAANCVLASAWIIVQASVLKKYRAELIMVFYYCFFVAIQSVVVSSILERDLRSWELTPKIRWIAVLYSAVFGSAFQVGVSTWCLRRTGPVFVAMFKPLGIIVTVFIGVTFLGDTFYLGSLIGAIVIVIGFYSVMWGKANEEKMDEDAGEESLASIKQQVPLLQSHIEEI